MGGFGEDLDILSDLTSTYNYHDFVLVHVAEKIPKKVTGFGSLPTANRGEYVGSYDRSICPLSGGISSLVTATDKYRCWYVIVGQADGRAVPPNKAGNRQGQPCGL